MVQNRAIFAQRLTNPEGAGPGIPGVGEDIAHVVKEHKAERVAEPGKRGWRQAQLRAVNQRAGSADGVARLGIARPGGVGGEAPQRSRSASVKPLGEGNQFIFGLAKGALLAVARVAGQHKAVFAEAIVARVRQVKAAEVGLRAEGIGGEKLLEAGVRAPVRVHR